jgi:putative MFS transporter
MNNKNVSRLDQLPISHWHWQVFFLLGFGLQINGFLNSSGSSILADLVSKGWSNNYLNAMFSSAMMVGFFVGSLGGAIGDKIGRKKAYQLCVLIFATFSLIASMSPNIYFLIVCRALMGVGMGGGIVVGYASFTEFIPARVRGKWSARISFIGNLSPLIASFAGFLIIPHFGWRMMFVVGSIAAFIILIFISKFLDESPRWCMENNRKDEGKAIVDKVIVRIEKEKNIDLNITDEVKLETNSYEKIPVKDFFRGTLGRRMIVATTVLIAMNVSLYTITVWIPTIFVNSGIEVGHSLLMTTLISLGAPLGVFASTILMDRFPRKWFGVVLILGIAILGFVYSQQITEIRIIVIGVIMTFVLYIYNSFSSAVYAPEVWPTQAKMRGFGIADAIGRIVAIFMPYLIAFLLTEYGPTAIFILVGIILAICALVLSIFGIETRKKSIEEIEAIDSKKDFHFKHEY